MGEALFVSYANAFYSLAKEEGKVAEYQTALRQISSLFGAEPALLGVLSSRSLPNERLYQLIDEQWGNEELPSLAPFMKLLVKKHIIPFFDKVVREYDRQANAFLGVKEGLVYSAAPLDDESRRKIEEAMGKKLSSKVVLINKVEPSLIGGVKVAIEDKVYDGTISSRIERMRAKLSGGSL